MHIIAHLSPEQSQAIADLSAKLSDLQQQKRRLEHDRSEIIAQLNRPHLVIRRWIRMQLIRMFN